MQHTFSYISLPPSLHDYDVRRTKTSDDEVFFVFLNLDMILMNTAPEKFAYIIFRQSKPVAIIAIEIERTRIHFLSDTFVPVVVAVVG